MVEEVQFNFLTAFLAIIPFLIIGGYSFALDFYLLRKEKIYLFNYWFVILATIQASVQLAWRLWVTSIDMVTTFELVGEGGMLKAQIVVAFILVLVLFFLMTRSAFRNIFIQYNIAGLGLSILRGLPFILLFIMLIINMINNNSLVGENGLIFEMFVGDGTLQ